MKTPPISDLQYENVSLIMVGESLFTELIIRNVVIDITENKSVKVLNIYFFCVFKSSSSCLRFLGGSSSMLSANEASALSPYDSTKPVMKFFATLL